MKKLIGIILFACTVQFTYSQNIRNNKFDLPVVENEIAFFEIDSVPNLTKADFYEFSKDWFNQTFTNPKISADNSAQNKRTGVLVGEVSFKIDDPNIKEPLNYTGKVTVQFINGVASIKLHGLKYTNADSKAKYPTNVTFEVTQQMRAKTDGLYPDTWNSLKNYANDLMQNFVDFMSDKNMEKL